ncbi:uncharacterized protein LOC105030291 isoform X2 [Esox lucius]|uniref:uncharacterized protein LOC105030291 isoform X2 n=1 Tax=Esox lucius TaxID=8010 RepID=UPI00147737D8|nr:uncharacterized protein LOC105030291 isoform X2 [Esox lucius]
MDFRRQERQWLTHLLIIVGLCFSISQTGEEMLTQVVGGSITFSNSTKQGGSLLYNGDNIAVVVEGRMDSSYKDSFKDRIQWDQHTGQFTIRDLKTSDSGMYIVDGKGGAKTTYQLTVYEEILNQTSSPDHSIKLFLPLEVDKQDRTSYRCEAANPVTKKNVTFHVPESCPETKVTDNDIERVRGSLIGAVMCVLVASGVLGLAIYLKKGRNRDVQDSSEREQAVLMYAEVTHSKPKHNQELGPCNENPEGRSVYDQIQLHRMEKCDNGQ